jgi:transketolase
MVTHTTAPPADLRRLCAQMRRWIIERSVAAHVGHIGSALSIVEIMAVLWGQTLRDPATPWPDRDRFILAKGHAALALYCVLYWKQLIDEAAFHSYCRDGSALAAHPEAALPGVEVATGSLGQGLSVGCGLAYALRRRGSPARVYVLLSDAECNEGQVWEAAMFAAHHHLGNLIGIIDQNGSQAMGPTRGILDLHPLAERWRGFGWHVEEVNGHDEQALGAAFARAAEHADHPSMIVARTTLGKGVDFMENRVEWHYRNLTAELAADALRQIGASR